MRWSLRLFRFLRFHSIMERCCFIDLYYLLHTSKQSKKYSWSMVMVMRRGSERVRQQSVSIQMKHILLYGCIRFYAKTDHKFYYTEQCRSRVTMKMEIDLLLCSTNSVRRTVRRNTVRLCVSMYSLFSLSLLVALSLVHFLIVVLVLL